MTMMVELDQVSKKFGDRKVLNGINLQLQAGEIHGFLGPNGAGKSTTIKIILGLLKPDGGSVKIFGKQINQIFPKLAHKIGVLPEFPPLYEDLILEDYFKFLYGLKHKEKMSSKKLDEIIDEFELHALKGRLLKNYSRGNKQKVALAQAFLGKPEIVILDEPTVGLDPENIVKVREIIKRAAKDCTVFLSSHLLSEMQILSEKITIINEGKILLSKRTDELAQMFETENQFMLKTKEDMDSGDIEDLKTKFRLKFMGQEDHYWQFQGDLDDQEKSELFQFLGSRSLGVLDAHWKEVNLEQVYLKTLRGENEISH